MRPYLAIQLISVFISQVSGASINVCELPIDRRQQLNISCNFDTKDGCTTFYTTPRDNYWKYQTQPVGNEDNGEITIDHQTGRSGGYYLFSWFNVVPGRYTSQLLTPFIAYNNICLRFWYILPNSNSNIKVIENGKELFIRNSSFNSRGWEEKIINISFPMRVPFQIAFESHTTTDIYSYVGIDDVVIEIERSSSTSTLATSTIPSTLKSSLKTASSVIDSNSKETTTTTASSSATSFTLSTTSSSIATSKVNTKDITQINPQASKITMTALKTTSTNTATNTTLSTTKLSATPTKTHKTSTSVAATSFVTAETPTIETSTTFQATHRLFLLLPTTNYIPKVTSKTTPRISIIVTTTPTTILPSTTKLTQATTTRDTTSSTTMRITSPRSTISFAMSNKTTITPFTTSTQTTSPTFTRPSTTSTTTINTTSTISSGIQMATLTTTRNTEINTPMTADTPTVISTTIVSPITTPVSRKTLTPTSDVMSKQTDNTRLSLSSTALSIPKTVTTPTTMFSKSISQNDIIIKTISDVLSTPQITSNHITILTKSTPQITSNHKTILTKSTAQTSTRKITRWSLSSNTANEINKHYIYSLLITTPSAPINISSITTPNTSMNTPSITTPKTPASTALLSFTALTVNSTLSSTKSSSRDSATPATPRTVFLTSYPFTTMSNAVKFTRKTPNEISRKETTSTEEKTVHVSDIAINISYERIPTGPTRITDFSPSGSYEKLTVTTTNPALFQSDGNKGHPNSEEGSAKHKGITGSSLSNEKLIIIVLSSLAGVVVLVVLLFVVHKLKTKSNSTEFITDHVDINKMNMDCEPTFYKTRIQIESL